MKVHPENHALRATHSRSLELSLVPSRLGLVQVL